MDNIWSQIKNDVYILIGIIFVIFAIYSSIWDNQMVWDDTDFLINWQTPHNISQNWKPILKGEIIKAHSGLYRPMRGIYYGVAYSLWGHNLLGYHFLSILIHISGTIAVYILIRLLNQERSSAMIVAGIFATTPIHVEAITWITASFDIIGVVIGVYGILFYIAWRKWHHISLLVLATALATIAYFSNEITLVLAGIVGFYDLFIYKPSNSLQDFKIHIKQHFLTWAIIFAPAVIFCYIRFFILNIGARDEFILDSILVTALVMSVAFAKQLLILAVPYKLSVDHEILPHFTALFHHSSDKLNPPQAPTLFSLPVIFSIVLICTLLYGIYKYHRKYPVISFLLSWHILAILPLMQIVPQTIIFGERYLYFASFGSLSAYTLILLQASSAYKMPKHLSIGLCTIIIALLGFMSYQRNLVWKNSETLWSNTLKDAPRSPYALSNLAKVYHESGRTEEALALLEEAYLLNPNHLVSASNLGLAYTNANRMDEAISIHQRLYEYAPDYSPNIEKMGAAYLKKGDFVNATNWYERYRSMNPNSVEAQIKYASVFHRAFTFDKAEIEYLKALEMSPNNPQVLWYLGELYAHWGKFEESIAMYTKAQQLNPLIDLTKDIEAVKQEQRKYESQKNDSK